jgi:hypothetical protein
MDMVGWIYILPALPSTLQHMVVLEKDLPEAWKLAIAKKVENNLLAKVPLPLRPFSALSESRLP